MIEWYKQSKGWRDWLESAKDKEVLKWFVGRISFVLQ